MASESSQPIKMQIYCQLIFLSITVGIDNPILGFRNCQFVIMVPISPFFIYLAFVLGPLDSGTTTIWLKFTNKTTLWKSQPAT